MASVQDILDQHPHAQECVNQALGFFQHNNIPLYELQWNAATQTSELRMKAPDNVTVFNRFVHGGYSLGILDAIGAFTGLLSIAHEGCQCLTKNVVAYFYQTVKHDVDITVITKIVSESIAGNIFSANVDIVQNGTVCVQGKVRLQKTKLIR